MKDKDSISTSEQDNSTVISKKKFKTQDMVTAAFLLALIVLLTTTPLGFLRIGPAALTLIHIPVIIGSIILGPKYGAFLGFSFGMASMLTATFAPDAVSFAFSPFYSVGDMHGNGWSLVIAFVPRILVGITPWLIYKVLNKALKFKGGNTISLVVAGLIGSLTNTILVLTFIGLFFTQQVSTVLGTTTNLLFKAIMIIVGTNGVPEAILASVITAAVCRAYFLINKNKRATSVN